MDVGNTPVDPAYANLTHRPTAQKWAIPWAEDDPGARRVAVYCLRLSQRPPDSLHAGLTAPELWLNRTLSHAAQAVSYGVGGLMIIHWRTRATGPQIAAAHAWAWDQTITPASYWQQWCTSQFSAAVGSQAAAVFTAVESYNLPRPVNWVNGPGGLTPDAAQCSWAATYAFVDTFVALRPALVAAVSAGTATGANLEAFDYWAYQFRYMRGVARMECDWASYAATIAAIQKISDPTQRQQAAIQQGIPARISLVANTTSMAWDLLSSASRVESAGTITNVLTHSLVSAIGAAPTATLQQLVGGPLPTPCFPSVSFDPTRAPSVVVPTVRTQLPSGSRFRMRAIVLSAVDLPAVNVTLFMRPLGGGAYTAMPLPQAVPEGGVARFVYNAALPAPTASFEWYVQAVWMGNGTVFSGGLGTPAGTVLPPNGVGPINGYFPPTAPATPATVVIV